MKIRALNSLLIVVIATIGLALAAPAATVGVPSPLPISPTAGNALQPHYVGPTENLTQVANAFTLQTYSLTTQVIFRGGLALTKPVCITVFYDSYSGSAYSTALFQAYDPTKGNDLVFNDPEGRGTPRQATLRVNLFEPGSGGCGGRVLGTGFDLPSLQVNLDPLYLVAVTPIQVARTNACTMLSSYDARIRWFSPDNQEHETTFLLGSQNNVLVAGSAWRGNAVSASNNYHMPSVGIYSFVLPASPSNVNIIPAPLAAGTPMPSQQIKVAMSSSTFNCSVTVQYTINRQLLRSPLVVTNLPANGVLRAE